MRPTRGPALGSASSRELTAGKIDDPSCPKPFSCLDNDLPFSGGAQAPSAATAGWTAPSSSRLNLGEPPVDPAGSDPPIDETPVVTDLESVALNRLHEVEILRTPDLAEDDVPRTKDRRLHGFDRTELAGIDSRRHRVPARSERDGLARLQLRDVAGCPPHVCPTILPFSGGRLRPSAATAC